MKPRTRLRLALILVVALFGASVVSAMPASAVGVTGTVFGVVTHESDPRATWTNQVSVVLSSIENGGPTYQVPVAADGTFSFASAAPGRYGLDFRYTGSGPWVGERWVPPLPQAAPFGYFAITAGSITEANGAIRVGATLSGHLSRWDGSGLVSPTVSIYGPTLSGAFFVDATTGNWTRWGIPPGSWELGFRDSETVPEWWSDVVKSDQNTPIVLNYGDNVTGLDAVLDRWSTISGTVSQRLPNGTVVPALGVAVTLAPTVGYDNRSDFTTYTDSSGNYMLRYVPAGDYTLSFDGSFGGQVWQFWGGGQTPTTIVVGKSEDLTPLDITLDVGCSISGQLDSDYTHGPLLGGQVIPERLNEVSGLFEAVPLGPPRQYPTEVFTYNDGTYTVGALPPGTYRLVVREPSNYHLMWWPGVWKATDAQPFQVTAGSTRTLSSFTLRNQPLSFVRKAGANRFGTVVETTKLAFPGVGPIGIPVVYVANGFSFPDALGAGPAVVHLGGALLTVTPTSIPSEVEAELRRLAPQRIVVVGGTTMVSDVVIQQLTHFATSGEVTRIAGADRYQSSRAIVRDAFLLSDSDPGGSSIAFIADGRNFPDALAGGPAAIINDAPMLLVDGSAPNVGPQNLQLLRDLGVTQIYLLGGNNAVHALIETSLRAAGFSVQRITGNDRYETAQWITAEFFKSAPMTFLATGSNFPDAIGGGAVAGQLGAPLMLTVPSCVLSGVAWNMWDRSAATGYILGGTSVLSAAVASGVVCP